MKKVILEKKYKEQIEWAANELVKGGAQPIFVVGVCEDGEGQIVVLTKLRHHNDTFALLRHTVSVYCRDVISLRNTKAGRSSFKVKPV